MGYQFNPITGKLDLVGSGGSATTDASLLTSGTLDAARLPSAFTGTNITAPNQTAASGSSILTRDLGDGRYPLVIAKKSTADIASTTTTPTDVTGLTGFTLEANTTYRFEFSGRHTNATNGGSHLLQLNSTAALASPFVFSGTFILWGTQVVNSFSNPSGNIYTFMSRSTTGNTNSMSSASYYITTGATAPTIKITASQTGTPAGTSTLFTGAFASFTKLI